MNPPRETVEQALERNGDLLSYRERRILELRYGLGEHPRTFAETPPTIDETPRSCNEIGRVFNVTGGRIRQIEKEALVVVGALPPG